MKAGGLLGNTKEIVIEKTTIENFVMKIKKYLRKLDRKKEREKIPSPFEFPTLGFVGKC